MAVVKPVYRYDASYAREHKELDQYRESGRINHDCKTDLQHSISRAFGGMHLDADEVIEKICEDYGPERVAYLLANTVNMHDWDGRFSNANKKWASYVLPERNDKLADVCLTTHPAVLDGFIDSFREYVFKEGLDWDGRYPEYQCSIPVLLQAMNEAGYHYLRDESSEYELRFSDQYAQRTTFKDWYDVSEWIHGVVFDDPNVGDSVYWVLHPERFPDNTRGNYYEVYQLDAHCPDHRNIAYVGLDQLYEMGKGVDEANYRRVYWNSYDPEKMTLEDIYTTLNAHRPDDYFAPSLSVSDIVVTRLIGEEAQAWYVDRFGFQPVPEFLEQKKQRSLEVDMEAERATNEYEAEFGADGWRAIGVDPAKEQISDETWTITCRVYGADGHRQRESFGDSYVYDFSTPGNVRVLEVKNADLTGTNDYSEVSITRNTLQECEDELEGQITDGIFENSVVGRVVHIETIRHLGQEDYVVYQAEDQDIDVEESPVPRHERK